MRGMLRKHGTASELSNVLIICLQRWEQYPNENIKPEDVLAKINGEMKPFRRNDKFSDEICVAVQNQNDIGWGNMIKGRISKYWSKAQETCYRHMKEEEKHNGKTWGAQLVRILWMYSESIWMHRNDCKYGVGAEALDKQRERLRPMVEKLYDGYEDKVRLADQGLFHLNKDLRLKRHPRMIKKWIKIVRMCIAQHKKEKKRGLKKQRKITRYFGKRKKVLINGNGLQTYEANEQSVEVETPPDRRLRDTG